MNKRKYSIPNNRYERLLNLLGDCAYSWNCMSITCWDDILIKFGCLWFVKIDDDDESVNESTNDVIVNKSTNDIEFTTKRELYNYLGIGVKWI